MISVLFCSRRADNPDCNLIQFLDSVEAHVRPDERDKIELLIKFDDDDLAHPPAGRLDHYPFAIRQFRWSRGEGRHSLHHAQEYMFAQRDPRSRFCLMTADDFVMTRTGFASEILAVPDEICILGAVRPPIERFVRHYEKDDIIRQWNTSFGPGLCPIYSARLIEICQNFGWQANVDSWGMGLSVVLYDLYGIVIWKKHEPFYARTGGYGLGDTPTYNNMEITAQRQPANKYWFELLRRQARNVYLNLQHGTDFDRMSWGTRARKLVGRAANQPLHRLPRRVARQLVRGVRSFL